jgi:NADPH2:quinone reductase
MIERGVVAPIVGARLPLERAAEAVLALERRQALGKVVLDLDLDVA